MIKQKLKSSIRKGISALYFASHHLMRHLKGKVVILMYHRVVSSKELGRYYIQPGMYVKNDVFEMQMKFLKEHFEIVSLTELLELWKDKKLDETKRYCVITFDDGWMDNYVHAYPVLKRYDMPATIFIPTTYIGTDEWFWPDKIGYLMSHYYKNGNRSSHEYKLSIPFFLKNESGKTSKGNELKTAFIGRDMEEDINSAIETCKGISDKEIDQLIRSLCMGLDKKLPSERVLLNWQEIEEMSENRISFGSHSCSHKILTKLDAEQLRSEIADSLHVLREKGINSVPVFCYPNGDYSDSIIEQVKASGYQAAVSTVFGIESNSTRNGFCLRRIGVHNDISSNRSLFAFRISGIQRRTISSGA